MTAVRRWCWNLNASGIVALILRLSLRIHPATGIVGPRFGRMRREVREHFVIRALCASRSVKFSQSRIVPEKCLQARRLRGEQLHLRVEHIQLRSRTGIQARLGQPHRFFGLLYVFFLALNLLAELPEIGIGLFYLEFDLPNVIVVSVLGLRKQGALLYDLASDRAAIPDGQTTLDGRYPTFRDILPYLV